MGVLIEKKPVCMNGRYRILFNPSIVDSMTCAESDVSTTFRIPMALLTHCIVDRQFKP